MTFIGDQSGMEAPTKEGTVPAQSIIDMARVQGTEALHRVGQVSVRAVPQQVEVVVHQAVGVRLDAESIEHVGQALPELDSIALSEEHVSVVGSTIHHVVPSVFDVGA
ncbi:MAG TPA: hypothetical protein VLN74_12155 [Ilumatobacteraceae bacterium]|nr:hypothetical protein [Ilumatobacteraceae bacterium]